VALTPEAAAAAFVGEGATCAPLAGGHINDSWLVRRGAERCFLQRINARVFRDPRQVVRNVTAVTAHVRACREPVTCPLLLPTRTGRPWLEDEDGGIWRCMEYVDAEVKPIVGSAHDAREAALAFGAFSRMMASYAGPPLPETIPGFHDTAARLRQLEQAVTMDPLGRAAAARSDIEALRQRAPLTGLLPSRMAAGTVPCRLAHNDAKIANVLFDRTTGRARWVVDLDTVMPGSLLHDFGDLVRSSVTRAAEDDSSPQAEPELFEALAEGFLLGAGDAPTVTELALLESAGRLITFEQAARFLTDHLQGDTYYRIDRPGQNLERARSQLALLESLEAQSGAFRAAVERLSHR
jgi:aminoglycoside phosphotransferase (APT) family kinase protein